MPHPKTGSQTDQLYQAQLAKAIMVANQTDPTNLNISSIVETHGGNQEILHTQIRGKHKDSRADREKWQYLTMIQEDVLASKEPLTHCANTAVVSCAAHPTHLALQ
jgi:tRNA A37 threonylcarbamoyladenosine dehydratase